MTVERRTESEQAQRPIEYARAGEFHIAYTVRGTAGPAIVLMLGGFVPLDAIYGEPRLSGFVRRLERIGRVVLFNRRGVGLSDSVSLTDPPTLDDWVDDTIAVLDAAGIETAFVIAGLGDIKVAIATAARAPDRIDQLISINGAIRPLATVLGMDGQAVAHVLNESLRPGGGAVDGFDQLSWAAPSLKNDAAFRNWWDATGRRGASLSTARALLAIIGNADVTVECESLDCPILA
jgi:pimeloyl-ACP methyl ester carboxylesterase